MPTASTLSHFSPSSFMLAARPFSLIYRQSLYRTRSIRSTSNTFAASARVMAAEYKLKGLSSLDLTDGELKEVEVDGVKDGKVLLTNFKGKVHAMSANCTHYGAPLKNGVVTPEGRLTCPWHGACFNVGTGDVEDAPALDPLAKFELVERDGAVYVKGEEETIKANRRKLNLSCSAAAGKDKVVVIGGGSGTVGTIEGLRGGGFKGEITVIASEGVQPYDRTKVSKALMADISKVAWRSPEFYKNASIDIVHDKATSIDFDSKTISTESGKTFPYTKLVLATGGSPRSLPLDGLKLDLKNVFLLRTLEHAKEINNALGQDSPKKIVVIGSSFIGMEVANCLAGQKHDVTVVGMESEPTEAVFGAKIGKIFRGILEKNGVKFKMSASVSHATPSSKDSAYVGAVHLKDGTELPAEIVIEGVGVSPATGYLKDSKGAPSLEKDGSLNVDETFAVKGFSDVYAIGDIATYPYRGHQVRIEHWNVAQNAGRTVAKVINSPNSKPRPFIPTFWSALGMQLRYCGNTVGGYDDVVIQGKATSEEPSFAAYYVKGDEVVAVATMGKDPVMVKSAELMRHGKMLSRQDIEGGKDVLQAQL